MNIVVTKRIISSYIFEFIFQYGRITDNDSGEMGLVFPGITISYNTGILSSAEYWCRWFTEHRYCYIIYDTLCK